MKPRENSSVEINKCPGCCSVQINKIGESEDWLVTRSWFSLYYCDSCQLIFTNPRPNKESIGKFYESNNYISHSSERKNLKEHLYQLVKNKMLNVKYQWIKKKTDKSNPKVFDFGCGTGDFLQYIKSKGFIAEGLEPNDKARNISVKKNIRVFNDIKILKKSEFNNKYDIITAWHVLEHVYDLNQTIKTFENMLSDNGLLIIALPNYDSYDARYYGYKWAAWDVPRHLSHFNQNAIDQLVEKYRFKKMDVKPLLFDAWYVSLLSENVMKSNLLLKILRTFLIGLWSNLAAFFSSKPYSSQVYFYKKLA